MFGYNLRAGLRAKDVDAASVLKQPVAACSVNDETHRTSASSSRHASQQLRALEPAAAAAPLTQFPSMTLSPAFDASSRAQPQPMLMPVLGGC